MVVYFVLNLDEIIKLPVMVVYFVLNLDEIIKLPVVYKHYKKYKWIKNLT